MTPRNPATLPVLALMLAAMWTFFPPVAHCDCVGQKRASQEMASFQVGGPDCPEDGNMATFTGRSRSANGRLLYEYRCTSGHYFWAPAPR